MSLITNMKEAKDMMLRVYNGKAIVSDAEKNIKGDEEIITELCGKVFGDGSVTPNPALLHDFNNIVVRVADTVAQPDIEQLLNYFANYQNVPADTQMIMYTHDHPRYLKFKWSADGSEPILRRVEQGTQDYITISMVQTGISYNPLTLNTNCVENFKALVGQIAQAKVQLVYETIMNMIQKAVSAVTSPIPAQQKISGANITTAQFNKVANIIGRRTHSKPLFLADTVFIDHLADQIETKNFNIITDSKKDAFYGYNVTDLRTADAVALVNDFTTLDGIKTQFPVNTGYVVGGAGNSRKPFEIAMAGGLTQITETEAIEGRIKMTIRQKMGVDFLAGYNLAVITDDSLADYFSNK